MRATDGILAEIVASKREFLDAVFTRCPLNEVKKKAADVKPAPAFESALRGAADTVRVIAEVKKASPSKGVIREDFDPVRIAESYALHQAAAISVLTDEQFFQGSLDYLEAIRGALPSMPLLRKDFTIDEYQVYEARAAGASAVLLITGILDRHELVGFRELATELGMAALTEVHDEREADLAAEYGARLIGVNNRDLRTFDVDISRTGTIIDLLGGRRPEFTFVGESGIFTRDDASRMAAYGCDAVLVGESLMRREVPGEGINELLARD